MHYDGIRSWTARALATVALVLAAMVPSQLQAAEPWVELDSFVRQAVEDWRAPGLSVAVVKDGQLQFVRGYGVRELGKPETADPRTLYAIGSTTKAMTAALLGMLADEDKLDWDDPANRYLPWFQVQDPYVTRELTIRDLLTHRGGLGNADFLWYGVDNSSDEILRRARFLKPAASLRSRFIYQNIMYAAAGRVAAEVGDASWQELIRERIFQPLGMSDSVPTAESLASLPNVASPHFLIDQEVKVIENASVDSVAPAGSVWSSVGDMAQWMIFLLDGCRVGGPEGRPLLKEATCEELFTPQMIVDGERFYPTAKLTQPRWTTYGLGWFQHDYHGRAVDFHTGSIDGMSAIVGLVRKERLGVCVLVNLDHAELRHALMYRVFDLFSDSQPRDWSTELLRLYQERREKNESERLKRLSERVEGTSPSKALEEYVGRYSDPLFGQVVVSLEDGSLKLVRGPGLIADLEHFNFDTFVARWRARWRGETFASFSLDRKGDVSALEFWGASLQRVQEGAERKNN